MTASPRNVAAALAAGVIVAALACAVLVSGAARNANPGAAHRAEAAIRAHVDRIDDTEVATVRCRLGHCDVMLRHPLERTSQTATVLYDATGGVQWLADGAQ